MTAFSFLLMLCFQANSNYADAKTRLEFLCKDLSTELAHFDWRKEVELREILIEYSALRSEHFEKVFPQIKHRKYTKSVLKWKYC